MKRVLFTVLLIAGGLLLAGCPAAPASLAGDSQSHTANSVSFDMHHVPAGGPFTMGEHVESTL